jgi:hypothetical protein
MRAEIVVIAVAGCGGSEVADLDAGAVDADVAPEVRLADTVIDAPGASGRGFGDPMYAVNGVRGGGASNGSVDVYSLGYDPGVNDSITLGWADAVAGNGPGDDLAVFENPFVVAGGMFMDLVIVEVSRDGAAWYPIAHDYVAGDETAYVHDPAAWPGFGGRSVVLLDVDLVPVDPFDRDLAGGDGFDLDDVVGDDAGAAAIRADGARQVRLVSAPARVNPDTGDPYVHDAISNGADIDGLAGRYVTHDP